MDENEFRERVELFTMAMAENLGLILPQGEGGFRFESVLVIEAIAPDGSRMVQTKSTQGEEATRDLLGEIAGHDGGWLWYGKPDGEAIN